MRTTRDRDITAIPIPSRTPCSCSRRNTTMATTKRPLASSSTNGATTAVPRFGDKEVSVADFDDFDVDRSVAQAWTEFQARLSEVVSMIDDSADLTIGTE